eukprot:scaffold6381_cov152-Isochrysis_galbana.AAC.3
MGTALAHPPPLRSSVTSPYEKSLRLRSAGSNTSDSEWGGGVRPSLYTKKKANLAAVQALADLARASRAVADSPAGNTRRYALGLHFTQAPELTAPARSKHSTRRPHTHLDIHGGRTIDTRLLSRPAHAELWHAPYPRLHSNDNEPPELARIAKIKPLSHYDYDFLEKEDLGGALHRGLQQRARR